MGKINDFVKNNSKLSIYIVIGLLIVTALSSGAIGNRIGKSKPTDLDFDSIYDINQIFDGFSVNVFNDSTSQSLYFEYSLSYYGSNFTSVGHLIVYSEPDNYFTEGLAIDTDHLSDCTFESITFVLGNDIDYSRINVVVYGDGDLIYCNSNIKSDLTIEFDPNVIEITILVF